MMYFISGGNFQNFRKKAHKGTGQKLGFWTFVVGRSDLGHYPGCKYGALYITCTGSMEQMTFKHEVPNENLQNRRYASNHGHMTDIA